MNHEEAYKKVVGRMWELLDLVYPDDFVCGCEKCEEGSCDCDPGVVAVWRVWNALAELGEVPG